MPSKNTRKVYVENGYYHIYNAGLNKALIFKDLEDSNIYLHYLETALTPTPNKDELKKDITVKGQTFKGTPRQPKNFHDQISVIAYVLMPTHFHFLIHQNNSNGVTEFMRSLSTRYSMYFNRRYQRQGPIFQSRYKGILVNSNKDLLHLTRYIHRKPLIENAPDLANWHSSYGDYIGSKQTPWVQPSQVLDFFHQQYPDRQYRTLIEDEALDSASLLGNLTLDQ